jgi:hypothetical protein
MQHYRPGPYRSDRYPPGWWMWPFIFLGAFLWAMLYLLVDALI